MPESRSIRAALPQEADDLSRLALRSKAHWRYSKEFLEACKAELTVDAARFGNSRYDYFVCCDGTTIQGFYALEALSDNEYELEALFVEPEHIGKGVGRSLIQHAIRTATQRGAERVIIQGDPNATDFYAAAGARRTGERESGSIPGRALPIFEIEIDRS